MKRTIILVVSLLVGFVWQSVALSQEKRVNAQGEAAIINNDLPS